MAPLADSGPVRDHSMSRLTSFQKLALSTTAATYLLILVGGLVRASGAGLGCPDWPRCFGSWIPPASAAELPSQFDPAQFNPTLMWTEYVNRILGVTVGLLIIATLVSAFRHHRHVGRILWPTLAAFLLVGFEGWLGGVVVRQELASWIVTIHLLVALLIVSLLLYATVFAFFATDRHVGPPRRPLSWLTLALIAITVAQVTLGAQVRAGVDEALDRGLAGSQALAGVGAFDRWHREVAALVVGAAFLVLFSVLRRHGDHHALTRAAYLMCGIALLQVALGATMAYLALTPAVQIAHLSASSLLLGSETVMWLLARWLPYRPQS